MGHWFPTYTCLHASSQQGRIQCVALGRQHGRMQQGRSQPGTSRRRSKAAAAGPVHLGPDPAPWGRRSCFAAPLAGAWLAEALLHAALLPS